MTHGIVQLLAGRQEGPLLIGVWVMDGSSCSGRVVDEVVADAAVDEVGVVQQGG